MTAAYPPARSRAVMVRNRTGLKHVLAAFLKKQAGVASEQLALTLGLAKMDDPKTKAAQAMANLHLDWDELVGETEPYLVGMAVAGGELALKQLGGDAAVEAFGAGMRKNAEEWAHDRAAEMVGKKWVGNQLVDNPDAKWAIDQSTRDSLQSYVEAAIEQGDSSQELADRIENSFSFSSERAIMVARTEIAKADSQGAIVGWQSTGMVKAKSWLSAGDDDVSDDCAANEAAGVVPLDYDYGDGVIAPPQHPNCRCTLLPEISDEEPGGEQ